MKTKNKFAAVLLAVVLSLALSVSAFASSGFNAGIEVNTDGDEIAVVVQDSTVLHDRKPTLAIPADAAFEGAVVLFEGTAVAVTYADGNVSFKVAKGGTYLIVKGLTGTVVDAPTCTAEGTTTYQYKDATYVETVEMVAHDFTDTAKKTCANCEEPNPDYVSPAEVVKPSEGSVDVNGDVEASKIISEVSGNTEVGKADTGLDHALTEENLAAAKGEIAGTDSNTVYEEKVVITLKAVEAETSAGITAVTTVTFQVTPTLVAKNVSGTEIGSAKIENLAQPITFRLPVPSAASGTYAKIYHFVASGQKELCGIYEVKGEGTNRYLEITSQKFSQYSAEFTSEQPVAQIGEGENAVKYATLAGALAAAQDGETITLLADITESYALTESEVADGETVRINLNGHTLCDPSVVGVLINIDKGTESGYWIVTNNKSDVGTDEPEGTIIDRGGSLVLDGVINLKRYIAYEGFEDLTKADILANGGMLVWDEASMPADVENAVHGTQIADIKLEDAGVYQGYQEYSIKYEVDSWEYAETYYFIPYIVVDGDYVYGDVIEYGVKLYCEDRFQKSKDEDLKSALVALLNYGAAAQTYFGLNTDTLANADLESYETEFGLNAEYKNLNWSDEYLTELVEPSADMTVNFAKSEGMADDGKSLVLRGAVSVKYYVGIGENAMSVTDATAYFWTAADYAALAAAGTPLSKENASYTVEAVDEGYTEGYGYEYSAKSDGIYAMYYGDTLYSCLCITDSDGVEHCSGMVVFSPEAYADIKLSNGKTESIDPVVQWLVVYGERAKLAV